MPIPVSRIEKWIRSRAAAESIVGRGTLEGPEDDVNPREGGEPPGIDTRVRLELRLRSWPRELVEL